MKYRNKFELHVYSSLPLFYKLALKYVCFTCKQAIFPKYIDRTLLNYHISITKSRSKSKIPLLALLISLSIFCLYKEQKQSFKRLAIVTCFTFGVSKLLHVHFHRKFWFISVRKFSEIAPNVHFREAKFQNFPGEHVPGPP